MAEVSNGVAKIDRQEQDRRVKVKSLEVIFRALQVAQARYLVVGGVAVIAHGYVRFTEDLDLVLDLSRDSLGRALTALQSLGYRPMLPVSIVEFSNPDVRHDWIENRNMKVFNLISDSYPDVPIDIFPKEPFLFETEYAAAEWKEVGSNIKARVVSVSALIMLKSAANRPRDVDDIDKLRKLYPSHES